MNREYRLSAFVKLGLELAEKCRQPDFESLVSAARNNNSWFTEKHIRTAFAGLSVLLDEAQLRAWAARYPQAESPKVVGVVMAGNIPMAGLHDLICVLMSGHKIQAKLSGKDSVLLQKIVARLLEIAPDFAHSIRFVDKLQNIDAVIATGSNNTSRYFDYYFRNIPNIIRKNRTSLAVIVGNETDEALSGLADDVFLHYGLGCRNVSKVWLPAGYSPSRLLAHWANRIEDAKQHHKYMNNYDYNRSIYLLNKVPHYDGGGLLMTESEQLASPVSVLFYEYYDKEQDVIQKINARKTQIQCVVSESEIVPGVVPMGKAQFPSISDYADGLDTMAFLSKC